MGKGWKVQNNTDIGNQCMKNVKQLKILGSETGDSQITIFPHAFSQLRIQDDGRQEEKLE